MVKAYARSEKEGFILVTFFHGDNLSQREKYTDWDQDFLGHTAEPRMALSLPENTGAFDKKELRISLPGDIFVNRLSSGIPHSPTYVQIEEITQGLFTGDQNSQKVLYRGRVVRSVRNYQGKDGLSSIFCLTQKSRLDIPMGIPCNHHCAWTWAKGGCGVVESSFTVTCDIDSATGPEITITTPGVTVPGVTDPRYWKRGYLMKDGLRISIRDYDGDEDASKFQMSRAVPTDWIAGSLDIVAVPGCDKTVETCRARYAAEEFFMGLGYGIPAYNPTYESPI